MNKQSLQLHIESIIFATDKPLSIIEILEIIKAIDSFNDVSENEIITAIDDAKSKYNENIFPFNIIKSGGGYQFVSKEEYFSTIAKINEQKFNRRLSPAALETLSIIAYKQPITKVDVEQIRGVSADYAIQRLLERNLVYISGRREDAIGKPLIYETTQQFLDYLGINDLSQLPKLSELPNAESLSATVVSSEKEQTLEES